VARRGRREQARSEQRRAGEQQAVHALRPRASAERYPERGECPEGQWQGARDANAQAQRVLGVEDEERRQRGVGEDPERLRDQHVAGSGPAQDRPQRRTRAALGPLVRAGAEARLAREHERGDRGDQEHDRAERERRGGGGLDQRGAERHRDRAAAGDRQLLRSGGRRAPLVAHVLGDQGAVRRGQRVQTRVDDRRRQAERQV
jgi:hypothetical protein